MIFDKENLFSDGQAITATAVSTNVIDLGPTGKVVGASAALVRDIGKGTKVPLRVQVVEAFNNCTSVTIDIQTDDNPGFSSPKVVQSATIPLANLKPQFLTEFNFVPYGVDERYVRLNYTVAGTAPTAGKITAGIVLAHQE